MKNINSKILALSVVSCLFLFGCDKEKNAQSYSIIDSGASCILGIGDSFEFIANPPTEYPASITYCGVSGNSFSISGMHLYAGRPYIHRDSEPNFYFPMDTKTIKWHGRTFQVIEVTPTNIQLKIQ